MHLENAPSGLLVGCKTSVNIFKRIVIMDNAFFDHNSIEIKINNKNVSRNVSNVQKLGNILLNYQWVTKNSGRY